MEPDPARGPRLEGPRPPGYRLLHAAAEWDVPEVAAVALRPGADPAIRDGTHGGTALGWAEHFGREGIKAMLS